MWGPRGRQGQEQSRLTEEPRAEEHKETITVSLAKEPRVKVSDTVTCPAQSDYINKHKYLKKRFKEHENIKKKEVGGGQPGSREGMTSAHTAPGKQSKVSTSPNTPGVQLPVLRAPRGVLPSPRLSASSSVKWVQQLSPARAAVRI